MLFYWITRRIREKYEVELEELERSERQAMEKYNQMKAQLLEAQGQQERLKVLNRQKEQEVDDIQRVSGAADTPQRAFPPTRIGIPPLGIPSTRMSAHQHQAFPSL